MCIRTSIEKKKSNSYYCYVHVLCFSGQVDLAETDENENENENERGNENEKGNGRQESYRCGIGRRSCKPTLSCKIVCQW